MSHKCIPPEVHISSVVPAWILGSGAEDDEGGGGKHGGQPSTANGSNGRIVGSPSEAYVNKSDCIANARRNGMDCNPA